MFKYIGILLTHVTTHVVSLGGHASIIGGQAIRQVEYGFEVGHI